MYGHYSAADEQEANIHTDFYLNLNSKDADPQRNASYNLQFSFGAGISFPSDYEVCVSNVKIPRQWKVLPQIFSLWVNYGYVEPKTTRLLKKELENRKLKIEKENC